MSNDEFDSYSNYELLCLLLERAKQQGAAMARFADARGGVRRARLGALVGARSGLAQALEEFYRRADPAWRPPAPAQFKKALQWLAGAKARAGRCDVCTRLGALKFRNLEFYTNDTEPLPVARVLALAGRPLEEVQKAVEDSILMCSTCARKRGVKMLKNRQPALDALRRSCG